MIFPDMPDEIDRRFNAGDHRLSQIARESILGGMFFDLQQKASGSVKQINPGKTAERAKRAEFFLAHVQGLVKDVFKPTEWMEATKQNFPTFEPAPGRWGFKGDKADEIIRKQYMGNGEGPNAIGRDVTAAEPLHYGFQSLKPYYGCKWSSAT